MSGLFRYAPFAMLLAAAFVLYQQWPQAVQPVPVVRLPTTPAVQSQSEPVANQPVRAADKVVAQNLLPSLADTEVDGQLRTDEEGNLVVDLAVRDYFDYFLSAADQSGIDAVLQALLSDAGQRLPEVALGQLVELLGSYLDYKRAGLALLQEPLTLQQQREPQAQLQALHAALERLEELRRAHFSLAVQEALFGVEQAYARYTLDSLVLQLRDDLPESQRLMLQTQLRERLPEDLRASERRQQQALQQLQHSEQLWREGADEHQVREFLAMTYDAETVQRLLQEQRRERDWQHRYGAYREELKGLQGAGLSAFDREQQQQRLCERLFQPAERHRVEIYDAIAAKQLLQP